MEGIHILASFYGCKNKSLLINKSQLKEKLIFLTKYSGLGIVGQCFYKFKGGGCDWNYFENSLASFVGIKLIEGFEEGYKNNKAKKLNPKEIKKQIIKFNKIRKEIIEND